MRFKQVYEIAEEDVVKGDFDCEESTLELQSDDVQLIGQAA